MKAKEIDLSGIVIIVGNYGSGKTEVSINLAVERKRAGLAVRVADLDLVNPYFRTREAKDILASFGIEVVLPPEEYLHADLPILSPLVAGMIGQPEELTLLDVGGNDVGARVLAALGDALKGKSVQMLQVVNPLRPGTSTVKGCLDIQLSIENTAGLPMSGYVGNANLIDETAVEDIYDGYDFVKTLSGKSGLPLEFITVPREIFPETDLSRFECPVLPIDRQLVPPWKKAMSLHS
ncbi:cobalamin biosynthesis protein CbiA [Thermodesulfobacteriota bacterium]